MLLAIDIGNTNITLGLYEGEKLGPRWRLATDHDRMPDEYGITLINLFQQDAEITDLISAACAESTGFADADKVLEDCLLQFKRLRIRNEREAIRHDRGLVSLGLPG